MQKEQAYEYLKEYLNKESKFNIFSVLKLENYEIRHSNFLAWLLNPNETHEFQGKFLKKFIEQINKIKSETIAYNDNDKIEVYREQDNIDILIINKTQKNLILLENKINSKEHNNQLNRYRKIVETNFNEYDEKQRHYIYLKPHKDENISNNYTFITYRIIIDIIDEIIKTTQNDDIKIFLQHYVEIFNNLYKILNCGTSLMDACLVLQKENYKLNSKEREIVWQMLEQRRYEVIQCLAEILKEKAEICELEQKIYRIEFNYNGNPCEFDNTNTKNKSQIKFIQYDTEKICLFLDENNYNEIFYTEGKDFRNKIKQKLSDKLNTFF